MPARCTGTSQPQLQLRMDKVEPAAEEGQWTDVAASCSGSQVMCVSGGAGTTEEPLKVVVSLASVPNPWRVTFV